MEDRVTRTPRLEEHRVQTGALLPAARRTSAQPSAMGWLTGAWTTLARSGLATALATCTACGSSSAASSVRDPDAAGEAPTAEPRPPIQPGSYRLRLSAQCDRRELTTMGMLTLRPLAGEEAPASAGDTALLWGQADLDFEQLSSCLGGAAPARSEPIHPSVLVEVLRWEGEPSHPVLLVSTEGARGGERRLDGAGIAMWVEHIEQDHMSGVWSRWQMVRREEGRWEAELVTPL